MILQNHIYVMRHGESENNVLGIESCDPHTQMAFGLTELGTQQVQAAAQTAPKFEAIYSSPFRRAHETAEIMAAKQDLVIQTEPKLHEFLLGPTYDQRPYAEAEEFIHESFNNVHHQAHPGGESFDDMHNRLSAVLKHIDQAHTGSTILLVTHGSPVETLIQIMKNANTGFGPFAALPKNAELIHLNTINLVA